MENHETEQDKNTDSAPSVPGGDVVMCAWVEAWVGRCKNTPSENGYCDAHKDRKCASCGADATHSCEATMALVCGANLCDDCEHTLCANGCNSGASLPEGLKAHCKKSEQVYNPWYLVESEGKCV